jgi:DNA recombination protein RmuC
LEVLLTPLDKQLVEFKTEITGFKAINEKMTSETESLTNALTSNVKVQGNWGEMVLERILEESGLEKGREYTLQGEGLGLKSAEGARQMPDVIINLPEAKHIVIDSKVSLTSFREYQNASTEDQRAAAAKAFILSTEKHIKDLAGKNYQNAYGLQSLDFVMMFMPIEAAYFLLLSAREDILRQAWEKGISIVSPSNLFPNLKTIGYLWRLQKQNDNAEEIARLGGSVYDKVSGFLGDMQSVGKSLVKAQDTHREAVKKLSEGNGNVMRQAEKLRELGAKTNKSLPDMTDV